MMKVNKDLNINKKIINYRIRHKFKLCFDLIAGCWVFRSGHVTYKQHTTAESQKFKNWFISSFYLDYYWITDNIHKYEVNVFV